MPRVKKEKQNSEQINAAIDDPFNIDYDHLDETGETEESLFGEEIIEEPAPKKAKAPRREKSTSTKGHYINNAALLPEVIRAKELGRITNELARMLLMIAERFSCKSNFVGYSFREDMVSFAMVNLMANALKFNPEKSKNPFAFYTTAIRNSFLQYLAYERNQRDIRDQLIVDEGYNPSNSFLENNRDEGHSSSNSDFNY